MKVLDDVELNKWREEARAILPRLEVPGTFEDGRVPLDLFGKELVVWVPRNMDSKQGDTVRLIKGGVVVLEYELTPQDAANVGFKAEFKLPADILPPDMNYLAFTLTYEYVFSEDGEAVRSGDIVPVIYDREPPGGLSLQPLDFTSDQKSGITWDDIVDDHLPVQAWPWYGMEVGDVITPWVSAAPPHLGDEARYLLPDQEITIAAADLGMSVRLQFPVKALTEQGDLFFAYRLRDRLGNTSTLSPTDVIAVDLSPLDNSSKRI